MSREPGGERDGVGTLLNERLASDIRFPFMVVGIGGIGRLARKHECRQSGDRVSGKHPRSGRSQCGDDSGGVLAGKGPGPEAGRAPDIHGDRRHGLLERREERVGVGGGLNTVGPGGAEELPVGLRRGGGAVGDPGRLASDGELLEEALAGPESFSDRVAHVGRVEERVHERRQVGGRQKDSDGVGRGGGKHRPLARARDAHHQVLDHLARVTAVDHKCHVDVMAGLEPVEPPLQPPGGDDLGGTVAKRHEVGGGVAVVHHEHEQTSRALCERTGESVLHIGPGRGGVDIVDGVTVRVPFPEGGQIPDVLRRVPAGQEGAVGVSRQIVGLPCDAVARIIAAPGHNDSAGRA